MLYPFNNGSLNNESFVNDSFHNDSFDNESLDKESFDKRETYTWLTSYKALTELCIVSM